VKDRWTDFFVMMNMSVLASVAGDDLRRPGHGLRSQDGNGWELDAIAAVFIGGAAVSGGIGTVIGSIIGGLVMAFLNNGMALLGFGADVVDDQGPRAAARRRGRRVEQAAGPSSITGFITRRFAPREEPFPTSATAARRPPRGAIRIHRTPREKEIPMKKILFRRQRSSSQVPSP
jgi:putative multiple sugar transport system permease protein